MVAAELRYVLSLLWVLGVLFVSVAIAFAIGRAANYSPAVVTGLAVLFICAFGYASVALWLRRPREAEPSVPERYAPIVVSIVVVALGLSGMVVAFRDGTATHWTHGFTSFASSCLMAALFGYLTVRDVRAQYLRKPFAVNAFTRRRSEQSAAARALPSASERRRALRPIVARGYIRLGLIALMIVLALSLAPAIGIGLATLGSFALLSAIFFISHWRFDL